MSWTHAALHRAGLLALLLVAYLYAWTPLRHAVTAHVARPLLVRAAGDYALVSAPPGRLIFEAPHAPAVSFTMIGGILLLLPAALLLVGWPHRLYWLYVALFHLGFAGVLIGAAALAVAGAPAGRLLDDFLRTLVLRAVAIGAPIAAWLAHRQTS
ncbi:hypothetical protein [Salisaeta longa]|uniref:hypothetical protein n=1 Tax=Salisaeta longa TaxID=503170 RepID=UPI0003B5BE85|nr:hypothetical protein [Salisaeta longa]